MNNQDKASDRNQRFVVLASVVCVIRSNRISNLQNSLLSIARESGQPAPVIQRLYDDAIHNIILPNFTGIRATTPAVLSPDQAQDLSQYDGAAVAFWRFFQKNNHLDAITSQSDQFADQIGVDPVTTRQIFQTLRQRTTAGK